MIRPKLEIWSAAAASQGAGDLERSCESRLTDQERVRARRFRKDTSRNQHIVGRGMTRLLLSRTIEPPLRPDEIELGFSPHGKPFVIAPAAAARPFNVAHTDGMVLFAARADHAAATQRSSIGVDVERLSRKTDTAIAERYFSAPEIEYVFDHADGDSRLHAFLKVWTLKEAFIKAVGTGLTMPLGDFAFSQLDDPRPSVQFLNPALDTGECWQFASFFPEPGFVAAVAVCERTPIGPIEINLSRFETLESAL